MANFLKKWKPPRKLTDAVASRIRRSAKGSRFDGAIDRLKRIGETNRKRLATLPLSHWPVWAKAQLDPNSSRYSPSGLDRLFNNFQNRNWTTLSLAEVGISTVVDPSGLVVPHPNSWSIDLAIKTSSTITLANQLSPISQIFIPNQNAVKTKFTSAPILLEHSVSLVGADAASAVIKGSVSVKNTSGTPQTISVVLLINPFNQEGAAPVSHIQYLSEKGFIVDHQIGLLFKRTPDNVLCLKGSDQPLEMALKNWEMILSCTCPNSAATAAAEFKITLEPNQTETLCYDSPAHPQSSMLPILRKAAPKIYQSLIQAKINDYIFDIARFDQTDRLDTLTKVTLPHSNFNRVYSLSCAHVSGFRSDITPFPTTGIRPLLRDIYETTTVLCDIGALSSVRSLLDSIFHPKPTRQTLSKSWSDLGPTSGMVLRYLQANRTIDPFQGVLPQLKREAAVVTRRLSHELTDSVFFKPSKAKNRAKYIHTPILDLFWGIFGLKSTGKLAQELYDFETANRLLADAAQFQSRLLAHLGVLFDRSGQTPFLPGDPHLLLDERICDLLSVVTDMELLSPNDPLVVETVAQIKRHFSHENMVYTHEFIPGISPVLSAQLAQIAAAQGDTELAWEIWDTLITTASATATWPERMHPQTNLGIYGEGHDLAANTAFIRLSNRLMLTTVESGIEITIPELAWASSGAAISLQNLGCKWGEISLELKLTGDEIEIQLTPNLVASVKDIFINFPKNIAHFPATNGIHRLGPRRLKFTRNTHHIRVPIETMPIPSFGLTR